MRQDEMYNLRERLHTEVLEEMYGKITLQLLHDDDDTREVLLTDQRNVALTYALTIRDDSWRTDDEICAVNDAIRAGEPIGLAFKNRGYLVTKNVLAVYAIRMPGWLRDVFVVKNGFAKARIMEFIVKKQSASFRYGYVAEVYSPDFRKPAISAHDLAQIATSINKKQSLRVGELKQLVNQAIKQIAPMLLFF